eukprot:1130119-Pleurochrysis_carterae.AAC.3
MPPASARLAVATSEDSDNDDMPVFACPRVTPGHPSSAPPLPPGKEEEDSDSPVPSPATSLPRPLLTAHQQALLRTMLSAVPLTTAGPPPTPTLAPPSGSGTSHGPMHSQAPNLDDAPRLRTSGSRNVDLRLFEGPDVARGLFVVCIDQLPPPRTEQPFEFDG